MWLGTVDYYHGYFYEPCFYGQSYNTMLESFIAIPLYALGCPLYIALPIVTSLLALTPIIYLSVLTFLNRSRITGIIIILITFLLPIEYDFLTSISRGFVTGIFIVSLSLFSLFRPFSVYSFFICGLLSIIGFIVNPNSILLSLPCLFFLFLYNYKNKKFYIYTFLSMVIGGCFYLLRKSFYDTNPNYILHQYDLTLSTSYFLNGIKNLDRLFNYITPIFWKQGFLVLLIPIAFALYYYKQKMRAEVLTSIFLLLVTLSTLFISKIYHGTSSVFFSYSRMFLAIPILIIIMTSFIRIKNTKYIFLFIMMSLSILTYKVYGTKKEVEKCINNSNHGVCVSNTKHISYECKELYDISKSHNINLIIFGDYAYYDLYNYGCPACISDFPKTLRPAYERRTWRLLEDENTIYNNILIIDLNRSLNVEFDFVKKINERNGFYLIDNNKLTTLLLMEKLNFRVRSYKKFTVN